MSLEVSLKMKTMFSPDDDVTTEFLQFISATSSHLRIAIYGLHLPVLIDEILKLHNNKIDVAFVCDETQADGHYERPEVVQLKAAGVPIKIGTSSKHRIMHNKFVVQDQASVWSGSWNFSSTASLESNQADLIYSVDRATLFLSKWQEMWDWIDKNEEAIQDKFNAPTP